jgi:hypothetical protein
MAAGLLGAELNFLVINQRFVAWAFHWHVLHSVPGRELSDLLEGDVIWDIVLRLIIGAISGAVIGAGRRSFRWAFVCGLLAGFVATLMCPGIPMIRD